MPAGDHGVRTWVNRTPRWRGWVVVMVLMGGALLLKSGSVAGAEADGARLGIVSPSEQVAAPDFTLDEPAGSQVSLREFRGKLVFVTFWATWCIPCRAEMPAMEQLYQEFRGDGLVVAAVNFQDAPEAVQAFRKELRLTFPVALDRQGTVASAYGVRALPTTYLVDREGRIIGQSIGGRAWDSADAKAYFQQLLAP